MPDRWTVEDISREFGISWENVRQRIRRCRKRGIHFDVETDPLTGIRRYLPDQIRAAFGSAPGRGWRKGLTKNSPARRLPPREETT